MQWYIAAIWITNSDSEAGNSGETYDSAAKMPEKRRKNAGKLPINEQEQKIYEYMLECGSITASQAMKLLGVKQRRAREVLSKMIEEGWPSEENRVISQQKPAHLITGEPVSVFYMQR